MNPDDILPSAMDFRFNPVRETQWSLLLQTGKGMVSHIASAPDKAALDDSKLLLAQFALASSRQIVPIEDRAECTSTWDLRGSQADDPPEIH
jgi:hypothetical protein